ncbi:MAG: NAD-dependent epimerase/dehydratase family protein, partial [Nitrospinaceae bacterium]|nr:NAD-dependent epimerase/dehydratase family protein [Nitrospinaceae bacterium]
ILGERYSHGHVFDFYRMLLKDPKNLHVLGDGSQKKSYLYIQDCLDAILLAIDKSNSKVNIFNLGTDEYCEINDSIKWITSHLRLAPKFSYSGGKRGWIGDNPFIFLDTTNIKKIGWKPKRSIQEGILNTLVWLQGNHWILEGR